VLFLDELPEFGQSGLEVLRQPLEDGHVVISRAQGSVTFPAKFMLVGAMNPCPCGYHGDPTRECGCSPGAVARYQKRLSGPLLDRIDVHVEVPRVAYDKLAGETRGEPSAAIRAGCRRSGRGRRGVVGRDGAPVQCRDGTQGGTGGLRGGGGGAGAAQGGDEEDDPERVAEPIVDIVATASRAALGWISGTMCRCSAPCTAVLPAGVLNEKVQEPLTVSAMVQWHDRSAHTSCRYALSRVHCDDNETFRPDRLVVDADSLCELPMLIRYSTDLTLVPHNRTGHMLA
jgi:hypothetical protein